MRCFSVTESSITPYLTLTPTPYPHIGIGEMGRGREYTRFPVGRQFAESLLSRKPCPSRGRTIGNAGSTCRNCGATLSPAGDGGLWQRHPDAGEIMIYGPIERASVIRTREKGTLLLVEERDPADRRALVLANISAGFRGDTDWSGADRTPCPKRGQGVDRFYNCDVCGTGLVSGDHGGIHPDDKGWVYTSWPPAGVTVLAEGYEAQGAAGRMGGHAVRLLILEPGAVFRVLRLGRLYGAPAARYIAWDGETLHLGTRDEIYPPSEEAAEGEII